jgi:hypothetical protein
LRLAATERPSMAFPPRRAMVAPLPQPGGNAVQKGAEMQTSDAQLKRVACGGFNVLVAP